MTVLENAFVEARFLLGRIVFLLQLTLVTCNTLTEKQKKVFYTRVKFRSTFFVEMKLLSSVRVCDSEAAAIVLSVLK